MKKRILLLLPLSLGIFTVSCGDKKEDDFELENLTCKAEEGCHHIEEISPSSGTPSGSFTMKLNDAPKTIGITVKDAGRVPDREKQFSWTCTNNNAINFTVSEDTLKVTITPKAVGNVSLRVENDFDETINRTFNFEIVNVSEGSLYIWEYPSTTKGKGDFKSSFGVDDKHKEGIADGTVNLAGKTWTFHRDPVISYNTNPGVTGAIGFGKGVSSETDWKTEDVKFTLPNSSKVKSITVETASGGGQADFTISVGGTVFKSCKAPKAVDRCATKIVADNLPANTTGDIVLNWDNPDFDYATYNALPNEEKNQVQKPGAVILKSISIVFE